MERLFIFSGLLSLILLMTGIYRPWVVLWWAAHQNRRKVIRLYGSILTLSIVGYLVVAFLKNQIP